tara:strand:+ start:644 stop:787 length:144 start_codon:yes stop_codon:yes gene_type:complete
MEAPLSSPFRFETEAVSEHWQWLVMVTSFHSVAKRTMPELLARNPKV